MKTMNLRVPDDVHAAATAAARAEDRSLNSWIVQSIRARLIQAALSDPHGSVATAVACRARRGSD